VTVRWTPEAVDDLARLHDFLAAHNPQLALRVVATLRNAVRQLFVHPRLGSAVPGFEGHEVRRLVIGDYELRYEIAGEALYILRFFHTGRIARGGAGGASAR